MGMTKQEYNKMYGTKHKTQINQRHRDRYANDTDFKNRQKIYQIKHRLMNGGSCKKSTLERYDLLDLLNEYASQIRQDV